MSDNKSPNKETKEAKTEAVTNIKDAAKAKAKVEEKVQEVEATSEATGESAVTEVEVSAPAGKVRVRNVTERNIHTSNGKIFKGQEGLVSEEEAELEDQKEHEDKRFVRV